MQHDDRTIPRDSDGRSDRDDQRDEDARRDADRARTGETPNPPHTTTGKITSPKFGSAGSGGLELEPGLDRD